MHRAVFRGFIEGSRNPSPAVHGKLVQRENQPPAIETADHKLIVLAGMKRPGMFCTTSGLAGLDVEAKGHFTAADRFQVDPFHRALYAIRM
jgi:hypothetical protein